MVIYDKEKNTRIEQIIIKWITEDTWMMGILRNVQSLNLPDSWVCAGFVRSKIWDVLHQIHPRTPLADIDVVYYNAHHLSEAEEKEYEHQLSKLNAELPWSVKNEARMHLANHIAPYSSTIDAVAHFPETATALAVRLNAENQVVLAAPCGLIDVFEMNIRINPRFVQTGADIDIYQQRIHTKNWQHIWHQLKIIEPDRE